MPRLHDDELSIDADLVRDLVDGSFPEHAVRDLAPQGDSGSSNALYRLGDDLVVRLPRQSGGGATILKEARWLPWVADRVTTSVPQVVGVGEPGARYCEHWAITTWLTGSRPTAAVGGRRLAGDLARFITELRAMEIPPGAENDPTLSWYRGLPLADLDRDFRQAAEQCRALGLEVMVEEALRAWDLAIESSGAADPSIGWYHGDLLVENLLVDQDGGLAAVLDFGGLAIGHQAVDLVVAWEALDGEGRREFRRVLDVDDATWSTARGWALLLALITFPYYGTTMPRRCADRLAMAHAVIEDV